MAFYKYSSIDYDVIPSHIDSVYYVIDRITLQVQAVINSTAQDTHKGLREEFLKWLKQHKQYIKRFG